MFVLILSNCLSDFVIKWKEHIFYSFPYSWPTGICRPHSEGRKVLRWHLLWFKGHSIKVWSSLQQNLLKVRENEGEVLPDTFCGSLWSSQMSNTQWTHQKSQSIWKIVWGEPSVSFHPFKNRSLLCLFDSSQKQLNKWINKFWIELVLGRAGNPNLSSQICWW